MVRPSDDAQSLMAMCLRLALQAITTDDNNAETISRTYKCPECGTTDDRTVEPDWDMPRTAKGLQPSHWHCDDCGTNFHHNIRITKKD